MTTILVCDITNLDYTKYLSLLSKYYYDKVTVYKNEIDKKLMVGCELLLRKYLKDKQTDTTSLNISLDGNKPYILDSPYKFSFSHSKKYSCCAISKNNIGVDIETKRIVSSRFKNRYNLQDCTDEDALIKWTRYESYYKFTNANISFSEFSKEAKKFLKSFKFNNYYLSVSLEKKEQIEIIEIEISDL